MDAGDRSLIEMIVAAEPVLALTNSPLAKADVLLRWASGVIAWSNEQPAGVADFGALAAHEMVTRVFLPRAGGVVCGGMAQFYRKLLTLFEVPSLLLQCGFADGVNHVTVLVPAGGRFYLFDPMFAGTYRSAEAWCFLDIGAVLSGTPFVFRCHRFAPAILRRPDEVKATRERWRSRNVEAVWTGTANEHGWFVAHVTMFDFQHRLVALPEDLAALGIAPEDDLISELIRRRVFAVRGDPQHEAACVAMLERTGAAVSLSENRRPGGVAAS